MDSVGSMEFRGFIMENGLVDLDLLDSDLYGIITIKGESVEED